MDKGGYLSRKGVVIPDAELFYCDGVVLVDYGDNAILEELLECVGSVVVLRTVSEIVKGEENLGACLQSIEIYGGDV